MTVCQTKIITKLMFFPSTYNNIMNYHLIIYSYNYKLMTSENKNKNINWMW